MHTEPRRQIKATKTAPKRARKGFPKKYGAISNWDKSRDFTSFYQEKFIEQGNLMLLAAGFTNLLKRIANTLRGSWKTERILIIIFLL